MSKSFSAVLLALVLFTATFAVNLQTPLYGVYAAQSDVGATAVTLAFAAYVFGLMPTLLFLGGLSDRIGRRLPIAFALLLGATATLLLVVRPSWESLFIARMLLGIGTGLVTTAGTAYMTELMGVDQTRHATLLVTSATSLGFGSGALATSLSLELQGPTLMPASFLGLVFVALILMAIVLRMPRVDIPKRVSLLRFPILPKGTWVFGIAMALAWSTTGMIIAVVPLVLKSLNLDGWIGVVVFLAIFVGFLCQPFARCISNTRALGIGLVLTPCGFLVLLVGALTQSIVLILLGTAITSAASYGFTYLSALFEFSSRAPDNRAQASAGMFIYAYIGFSFPVIASGLLADRFGLLTAMGIFSCIQVIVTLMTAWLWRKYTCINSIETAKLL